jgi:NifU-like protein involved in Fe-S cluster formation
MTAMKELYSSEIMALAANIPAIGRLPRAQGEGEAHSRLCGSHISVTLEMENGAVSRFAQEVKACLVGQASASIMGRNILGCEIGEMEKLREKLRLMLEEDGPPPDGKWADYALLEPVRNYKSRHSTLLIAPDAALAAMRMAAQKAMGGNESAKAGKAGGKERRADQ